MLANGEELKKNNALEPRAMMNQNIFGHDFLPHSIKHLFSC